MYKAEKKSIDEVINHVALLWGISPKWIRGERKYFRFVQAMRHAVMICMELRPIVNIDDVSKSFGGRTPREIKRYNSDAKNLYKNSEIFKCEHDFIRGKIYG